MPNRILKESITTSDTVNQLTADEEVFFYRLIVACDDYGLMDARPAILKSRLFPLRAAGIGDKTIHQRLARLAEVGLIRLYESEGRPYLEVVTWRDHQQVRAKKLKYPEPPTWDDQHPQSSASSGNHLIADASKGNHPQSNVTVIQSNPIQSSTVPIGATAPGLVPIHPSVDESGGGFVPEPVPDGDPYAAFARPEMVEYIETPPGKAGLAAEAAGRERSGLPPFASMPRLRRAGFKVCAKCYKPPRLCRCSQLDRVTHGLIPTTLNQGA